MDDNQITGGVKQAAGRLQNAAGALSGDTYAQVNGKVREAAGRVQSGYGDVIDTLETSVAERPLTVLGIAVGLSFLAGLLLARR